MSGSSQSPAMNQFGAFIFGLICVIFGIFHLVDNNQAYDEYRSSSDKQTVEAEVKKVTTRYVNHYSSKHGTRSEKKYECLYEYKINGNTMYHTESYSRPREVGSKTTFNVFLNKYGRYQVGTITSATAKKTSDAFGFIAIFIGLISFGYGACIKITPTEPVSNSVPSYLADIYNNNDNSNGYNNGNSYNNSNGYNNGNGYSNSNSYNNGNSYNNSNAHNNGNGYNNANSYNNGNANNNGNGYSNSNSYNDYYNEDNYKN